MKNNFETMAAMSAANMDIAVSVNNLTGIQSVKQGGLATVGVDATTAGKLMKTTFGGPAYHTLLYVVNAEQYEAVSKTPLVPDQSDEAAQLQAYKQKAEKWDALDTEISRFYSVKGEEDYDADLDASGLLGIGEVAASAFGYL